MHDARTRGAARRAGLRGDDTLARARRSSRATAGARGAGRSSASWAPTARRARRSCCAPRSAACCACTRPSGNFNNLVGVPLTLLALPDDADIAVIEMGTNQPGEVARAARDRRAGHRRRHVDRRGAPRGARRPRGRAARGAERVRRRAARRGARGAAGGRRRRRAARARTRRDARGSTRATCAPSGGAIDAGRHGLARARRASTVRVPLRGVHNLRNAMLALAVAREVGRLARRRRARHRRRCRRRRCASTWSRIGAATLINDAYNANPGSARAALELLEHAGAGRQRVAVLGTMLELGAQADRLHDEIARAALADADRARGRRRRVRRGAGTAWRPVTRASSAAPTRRARGPRVAFAPRVRTRLFCSRGRAACGWSGSCR